MGPERDDFDDDERDEFASRSIFSAGWFRVVLLLTVLAIIVVISLPYLLNWFEPSPPARMAKPTEPLAPAPSVASPPGGAPAPSAAPPEVKPAAPTSPAPKAAIAPPAPAPKAVAGKVVPPPSSEPAHKAVAEKPPAKPAAEKAAAKAPAEKTPAKSGAERPPTKTAEKIPAKTADQPAAPTRVAAKADAPTRPAAVAAAKRPADGSGNYWVQLGAFKDERNADSLAKTLREAGFPVQVTPIRGGGGGESKGAAQQHELFVTETSVEKVNAALKGRGTAQAVSGGVAVKPAFSLQEAMTVSKRLTDGGLKVVIRPAGGVAIASQGQGTLHAVRAGGYPNRPSALAARDELAAKGHRGFLAEGAAK